ncbi:hypothetical protein VE02_04259 [Pseudogymnoascus sp. 03VT05]|nr:hypothetical protein VE02_04259 [Pseudogymnoascus sp. 03VT05]
MAMKISTRTQTLLRPENLDPRIVTDLDLNQIADVAPVNVSNVAHDLINDLLQANRMSLGLEVLRQRAADQELSWT